jgi:hypothetical protein
VDKLTASDALGGANFGRSVAIDGDYLIVGAYLDDAPGSDDVGSTNTDEGSAYVFHRNGESWLQVDKLTASDAARNDEFGRSVAISGDYAVVGAFGADLTGSNEGSAYVFKRNGDDWTEIDKLVAGDAADGDHFGISVGLSGDVAIVGAHLDDHTGFDQGSAYMFQRFAEDWVEMDKLTASVQQQDVLFGASVAIDGSVAIVGAFLEDLSGDFFKKDEGAAYLFERSGDEWIEVERLTTRFPEGSDRFGSSVAMTGEHVLIGAPGVDVSFGVDNPEEGAAFVFDR